MSFTDIANRFFTYFNEPTDIIGLDTLIRESIEQIQIIHPKWIPSNVNLDDLVDAIKQIKNILNISTKVLNNLNELEDVKFIEFLIQMKTQHFHQNMDTNSLPSAFHSAKIKVEPIASCDFHKESLFEHSIMCMLISMVRAGQNTKKYVLSGFTGLFHDVGKINTITVYGKNDLGYPFHGAYGSTLLSQYGSEELFKLLGSKQNFLDVMHTIKDHMCSYHISSFDELWSIQRCEMSLLSYSVNSQVKELSHNLSYGDTFGKICDINDCETEFLNSREKYDTITSADFNCNLFMKKIQVSTPIFFVRGSSGSGKTTFIKEKLIPYLLKFFDKSRIEIISRDEIMCEIVARTMKIDLEEKRPIGELYGKLYKTYQSMKLGKTVNDEMKMRISKVISENRIGIIDSCILYYDGITQIMPPNITDTFKIAIDCNRSIPYTIHDAVKNGGDIDMLKHLYEFRNPTTWIKNIKYTILDSMFTRSSPTNSSNVPHMVFSYGFNTSHECGFDTFEQVLNPVMTYFV